MWVASVCQNWFWENQSWSKHPLPFFFSSINSSTVNPWVISFSKRLSPILHQRLAGVQGLNVDWQTTPSVPNSPIVKRILRLDIPSDSYPNVRHVNHFNTFWCNFTKIHIMFQVTKASLHFSSISLGGFLALGVIHWSESRLPQVAVYLLEGKVQ